MPDDVLMTTAETAALLRVHVDTLRRWRLAGRGPAYVRIGRTYRYWQSDVLAWVKAQRRVGEGGEGSGRT